MRLASRMQRLGTETAFEVLARAKALEAEGREVIHLEIGEPDFDTPANVVEAGVAALRQGHTHYTPSPGIIELRQAIADHVASSRNIEVSPDRVVVTPGGKPIMFFTLLALCEPGDEVIYPNPGFPIYESMINFVGATPVPIPLREARRFRLDVDELAGLVTDRTRLIIINSPHNPTGGALEASDLEAIASIAKERDILVMADEIYSRILYEGEHHSIASLPSMADRTVLLDGFSKTYAMTGWRLGYGVIPTDLAPQISKLVTNSVSCTAAFVQWAGVEALTGPQDEPASMVEEFRRRRKVLVDGLNSIAGLRCVVPAGAFYAFPNVEGVGLASREFADRLLYDGGVATLAGDSFGRYGRGYLRISYANSIPNLEKALERIEQVVSAVRR